MKILENAERDGLQVPVVPMALTNLWGSSSAASKKARPWLSLFRRGIFNRVGLNAGTALAPAEVQPDALRARRCPDGSLKCRQYRISMLDGH